MAIEPADLSLVCETVLRVSGIVLDASKQYLVEARLSALARKLKAESVDALLAKLRRRPVPDLATERAVVDAMTTNETSFFRDLTPFETFRTHVVPAVVARRAAERRLTMWCAASSTGQEPYTVAMLLREHFPQVADSWQLTFVASDLSREVLEKARAGRYTQLEVNRGLPAALMVKYFRRAGLEWEIAPEVRRMVDFREVNLLGAYPALPPVDVVFIRNVLIYFNQDLKRQILGRVANLMHPDGFLFLGAAETTLNLDDRFVRLQRDASGCHQLTRPGAARAA